MTSMNDGNLPAIKTLVAAPPDFGTVTHIELREMRLSLRSSLRLTLNFASSSALELHHLGDGHGALDVFVIRHFIVGHSGT